MDLYQSLVTVNPVTLIAQICNLFIQLLIVKIFFLDKIKAILDQRREAADKQIAEAEAAKSEAKAIKETYEQNMRAAKAKADDLLLSAQKTATLRSEEIISQLRLCGVSVGTWGPSVPIRAVENKLMMAMDQLSFCSVNLYGTRAEVPEEDYVIEIGKGDIKREGTDVTIVATSAMVLEALDAAEALAKEGISCEVVDPRTLIPLDKDIIRTSLEKTNRLVVVNEAWKTGSFAGEIAAIVAEEMFDLLDAPIVRLGALDMPIPYSPALEPLTVPNKDTIMDAVRKLLNN